MGFAVIENILYVLEGGLGVAFLRAILSIPGHGLYGVLMGYYFSLARFHEGEKRKEFLIKSLLIAIAFHGLYDFLLFYAKGSVNGIFIAFLLIAFAFLVILLWRKGVKKIKLHLEKDGKLIA